MAYIPTAIVDGVTLTGAEVDLYTVPEAATATIIGEIRFMNTDASEIDVTLYAKPKGQSAGVNNTLILSTVSPKIPGVFYARTVLNPGDTLSALASVANKVSLRVSGAEVK